MRTHPAPAKSAGRPLCGGPPAPPRNGAVGLHPAKLASINRRSGPSRWFRRALAAAAAALLLPPPVPAQVVGVTDGTFNNTDWSLVVVNNTTNGTPTAGQVSSGGNPGAYRSNSLTATGGAGTTTVDTFSFRNGFSYSPSTQGAIGQWTLSVDDRKISQTSGFNGLIGLAVRQNGTLYRTNQLFDPATSAWLTFSYPPTPDPNAFIQVSGPGPATPDFSNGGPIDFGYYVPFVVASAAASGTETVGVDNFQISITPVPEPSTVLLAGAGAVGILGRWGRRR